jgi:histidinol-phosphate aminotransferase
MAGARLGFGIASPEIITALNTLRCSTNPYNVNSITLAMGKATLENDDYSKKNCLEIEKNREWTKGELSRLGFVFTPSMANFIFARHPNISGEKIYSSLREKGILVRHFSLERIKEYNRITVGSKEEMKSLVLALEQILEENS